MRHNPLLLIEKFYPDGSDLSWYLTHSVKSIIALAYDDCLYRGKIGEAYHFYSQQGVMSVYASAPTSHQKSHKPGGREIFVCGGVFLKQLCESNKPNDIDQLHGLTIHMENLHSRHRMNEIRCNL